MPEIKYNDNTYVLKNVPPIYKEIDVQYFLTTYVLL